MDLRHLPTGNYRRSRWKNGGGETAEIAVFPPFAGLDDFGWRISMADVAADGPFSCFAGVDRTLALLGGRGIRLEIAGRKATELAAGSPPLAFPADVATFAALLDGPVQDLNVMTRRGRFMHSMERMDVAGERRLPVRAGWHHMFCASGRAEVSCTGASFVLKPLDSLLVCGEDGIAEITGEAGLLVTRISPEG